MTYKWILDRISGTLDLVPTECVNDTSWLAFVALENNWLGRKVYEVQFSARTNIRPHSAGPFETLEDAKVYALTLVTLEGHHD